MKKKGIQSYLFSIAGVAAMLGILIAVNMIASRAKVRVDLTSDKAYTLSSGTKAILSKLDTPVQVRLYCTRGENRMPVVLKNYAQTVEDLLGEFRQASKGQIEIQKLDPVPDSDAEDSAKLDGIEGQMMPDGDSLYLGLSVTMLDQKETIPFLSPSGERQLEYEIARAITRVMSPTKPVLGVMSPMPLSGQMSPMMMRQNQGNIPPWFIYSELKRSYDVKTVETSAESIPDDVKVLVIIHPKNISDATQYAIDQFVLRGGKLIAFLDPAAALDRQAAMMGGGTSNSNLDKLLKAWGFAFDTNKVVADMNYVSQIRSGRSASVLSLTENAMNKEDVLTSSLGSLFFVFSGAFTGSPVEGLKQTVLVKSSKDSQLIDPMTAQMGEQAMKEFAPSGVEYTLAMRLTGKFKTAFPNGKPVAAPKPEEGKPEEKKPDAAAPGLKESTAEGVVLLVGDSDFLQDDVSLEEQGRVGNQRIVMPANGNLAFAQSAIDQIAGDSNLISVRSRTSRERPFTVVNKMRADAEASFRGKIAELEASLADAQRKLTELQMAKAGDKGQKFILSPEQQAEILNFRKKEAEVKKQLKEERKKLNSAIVTLDTKVKWMNIALMPGLVIATGVGLAVARRRRQAAV